LYRERFLDIYEETATYKEKKRADWSVANKINKIQAIIEKVVPRIVPREIKYLLSKRLNSFEFESQDAEALKEGMGAMEDYLFTVFDKYDQDTQIERCALMMATYGTCIAKVDYRYETAMVVNDENLREEKVVAQYPTIDPKSWTDIYIDPRYRDLDEMPAIIEVVNGVRLNSLTQSAETEEYFNLDQIKDVSNIDPFEMDDSAYKQRVFSITGVEMGNTNISVDKEALNLKVYYGWFKADGDKIEKKYKITMVDDLVIIGMKEIAAQPFVDFRAFMDSEVYYATGFAERLIGMQRDSNFKMNGASEMINMGLNHMYFWSPLSGVNPRDLVSRPGGIVPTKDTELAMRQVQEIPTKQVPSDYFQDMNDKERDTQVLTHTIDVSSQRNSQALTNTATGARISLFESNAVFDRMRKRFEKSLEKLAYKFIDTAFDNIEDNIVFKKQGTEDFWAVNKEAFKNGIERYDIKVESNSSTMDTLEGRRENAIAMFNTVLQAQQSGVPVNTQEAFMKVMETFEVKNPERFLQPEMPEQPAPGRAGGLDQPENTSPEDDLIAQTEAIAGGSVEGQQ
jgi:hypothetical protein